MIVSHLFGSETTDIILRYATMILPMLFLPPSNSIGWHSKKLRPTKVTIASATFLSTITAPYHCPLHHVFDASVLISIIIIMGGVSPRPFGSGLLR